MSYYEFIFSGVLTPEYERKVNDLLKSINEDYLPIVIHKYTDEVICEEKKNRMLVLYSHLNMWDYLYRIFVDCGLEMKVYYKSRII